MGMDVADVLTGTQVESADLFDPDFLVSTRDEFTMVRNLLRAAPHEPLLAARVGARASLTNFGLLGLAVMSCGSFREVIAVGLRFFALTSLHVIFDVEESGDWCNISLSAAHLPSDVRDFFIERDFVGTLSNIDVCSAGDRRIHHADICRLCRHSRIAGARLGRAPQKPRIRDVWRRPHLHSLSRGIARSVPSAGRPIHAGSVYWSLRGATRTTRDSHGTLVGCTNDVAGAA